MQRIRQKIRQILSTENLLIGKQFCQVTVKLDSHGYKERIVAVEYFFLYCGIERAHMKGQWLGWYYFCGRKFLQREINDCFL